MHRLTRAVAPVVMLAVLTHGAPVSATVTAQFWQELGGSGSGLGLTAVPDGLDTAVFVPGREVSVAVTPDGKPVVAYVDRRLADFPADAEVRVRKWNGAAWEPLGGAVNEPAFGVAVPRIKVSATGEIFVIWQDGSGNVYLKTWDGTGWIALDAALDGLVATGDALNTSDGPALALTPAGRPVIAFTSFPTGGDFEQDHQLLGRQVYVLRWTGLTWEYLGSDTSGGGVSNAQTFRFNFRPDADDPAVTIYDLALHEAVRPSIAMDGAGTPYVAFVYTTSTSGAEFTVFDRNDIYVVRWTGTDWVPVGGAVPNSSIDPPDPGQPGLGGPSGVSQSVEPSWSAAGGDVTENGPAIAIGLDGRPVVAWGEGDVLDTRIRVRVFNGATWDAPAPFSLESLSGDRANAFAGVEIGADGRPIVAWSHAGFTATGIRVARFDGTAWVEMGVGSATDSGIAGPGSAGFNAWLAVTPPPGRAPVVVWLESGLTGGTVQAYLRAFQPAAASLPVITSFTPASAIVGTEVTIIGTSLDTTTNVRFNGARATPTQVTATSLKVTVPFDATSGRISVTNAAGTRLSASSFRVLPHIDGFTPETVNLGDGQKVQIFGTSLRTGGDPTVKVGAFTVPASLIFGSLPNFVVFGVPPGTPSGRISIITADGTAVSEHALQVFQTPRLTSFTPAAGPVGTLVTINGTGLNGVTEIDFTGPTGPLPVTPTAVLATSVKAIVPSGAITGKLGVTNPAGTAFTTGVFKVTPRITGFEPEILIGGNGTAVTLTGTNLRAATGTTTVKVGGVLVLPALVLSSTPTTIEFLVPAAAPTGKISVTTLDGTAMSAADLVVLKPPRPTSFTPAVGAVDTLVTITGTNLAGTTEVKFGSDLSAFPLAVSNLMVKVAVPIGARTGKLSVINDAGTGTTTGVFKVAPRVTGFAPDSVVTGSGDTVTIAGFNLRAASGAPTVKIGSLTVAVNRVVESSESSIAFRLPPAALTGKLSVTTVDGTGISAVSLEVIQPPKPTSFNPAAAPVGSIVTINGANLARSDLVTFGGGVTVTPTIVSATSLKVVVPDGAMSGKLGLTNPAGTGITAGVFKVTPKIMGFTPAGVVAGGNTSVIVTGTNLVALTGTIAVRVGGQAIPRALVQANASTSVEFLVPATASTGKVSVTTVDGTALSASDLVVIHPPAPVSFSPTAGEAGSVVTINGRNLMGVTDVTFTGNVSASPVTVSATSLKVTVPPGALSGPVSVTNAAGTGATASSLKLLPKVTGFTPASGVAGDTITLRGTNLTVGGAPPVVKVGGFIAVVTSSTATEVVFLIPGPARTRKITLTTSDGTATSAAELIVTTAALPNLQVTQVRGPTLVVRSTSTKPQAMTVTTTVTNAGPAPAGAFSVSVMLVPAGTAPAPSAAPRIINVRQFAGLAPGASSTVVAPTSLPRDIVAGTWALHAVVDRNGRVAELDEDDNAAVADDTISVVESIAGAGAISLVFNDSAFCRPARSFHGSTIVSQTLDHFTMTPATLTNDGGGIGATLSGVRGTLRPDGSVDSGTLTFRTTTEDAAVEDEVEIVGFIVGGELILGFSGLDGATRCTFSGAAIFSLPPRPALSFDFFSTAGYFEGDTAIVTSPVAINSWQPVVTVASDNANIDPAVTIVGPVTDRMISAPEFIDSNGSDAIFHGRSVVRGAGPAEPPTGAWNVTYRGREYTFVVAAPQSAARLVIPVPALTILDGVVTRIGWTYVTPTGAPLATVPGFIRSVGVDLIDGSGNVMYASSAYLPDVQSVDVADNTPESCVAAVGVNYVDTLGNRYRITFARPNAAECGTVAFGSQPMLDTYLLTTVTRNGSSRLRALTVDVRAAGGIVQSATITGGDVFTVKPIPFAGANRLTHEVFDVFRLTANLSAETPYPAAGTQFTVNVTVPGNPAPVSLDATLDRAGTDAEFSFTGFAASTFDIDAVRGVTRTFTWDSPSLSDPVFGGSVGGGGVFLPFQTFTPSIFATNAKGERCAPSDVPEGLLDPVLTVMIPATCVGQPTVGATVCITAPQFDGGRSIHCRVYDPPPEDVPGEPLRGLRRPD